MKADFSFENKFIFTLSCVTHKFHSVSYTIKKPLIKSYLKTNDLYYGATYPIRTDDPRITSAMLWPTELKWQNW